MGRTESIEEGREPAHGMEVEDAALLVLEAMEGEMDTAVNTTKKQV